MNDSKKQNKESEIIEMIEKFQCNGCISGSDCNCGKYELREIDLEVGGSAFRCQKHFPGTTIFPSGKIYLGLPKGFNKVGRTADVESESGIDQTIRLINKVDNNSYYDNLNVAVWAMEKDGYLFVRAYCPRINQTYIDIYKDGKIKDICPDAIDVSKFIDEID